MIVDSLLDLMQSRGLNADEADAIAVYRCVLDAIAEPSPSQMLAVNALPVTKLVNDLVFLAQRHGGSRLPVSPNNPLEQWHRAMIGALRKEIEP